MKAEWKWEDRILATIHTDKYRKAYNRLQNSLDLKTKKILYYCGEPTWPLPTKVQKFCDKFGIPFPYKPYLTGIGLPPVIPVPIRIKGSSLVALDKNYILTAKIDMAEKLVNIMHEIERWQKRFKLDADLLKKKRKRERNLKLNKWQIYNEIKSGKTLKEIAAVCGMDSNENPASCYQQVRRDYYKAYNMVVEIERRLLK